MAAEGMAFVDLFGEAGASFGFGLSRLFAIGRYLRITLLQPQEPGITFS